jgi:hypothetical protein
MVTSPNNTSWDDSPEEQLVYSHLLYWVQLETPEQLRERFRSLFLNGFQYSDWQVQLALDRITAQPNATQSFKLFFNRCCHIVVNRWQSNPQYQHVIPEFFTLLEQPISMPVVGAGRSQAVRRLRSLVKAFIASEHYQKLRRMMGFMVGEELKGAAAAQQPLLTLIRRYPCLYPHALLSEDSNPEQQQSVAKAQLETQKKFEIDLSHYLTYDLRRTHGGNHIQEAKNPTLLSDAELRGSLHHFIGKVDRHGSYRDQAHLFSTQTSQVKTLRAFKGDFYEYLTQSGDIRFGGGRFQKQLQNFITSIPDQKQPFGEFQLVRTCSQMLNFLVLESPQKPNHLTFMDLLNNIGTTRTVGLLLKIVLVCKKVKPHLEKRFSILFHHYENHSRASVDWLVNCLENLNIAWSTHFGSTDFSRLSLAA